MAEPTVILDADVSFENVYFAIVWYPQENSTPGYTKVLRSIDITDEGAATWEEVLDSRDYLELEHLMFGRIRVAPGDPSMVVITGFADGITALCDIWCFVSHDCGNTWREYLVLSEGATSKAYRVTYEVTEYAFPGGPGVYIGTQHGRLGDAGAGDYNPWAFAVRRHRSTIDVWVSLHTGYGNTIHDGSVGNPYWDSSPGDDAIGRRYNDDLPPEELAIAEAWMDDYFGVGEHAMLGNVYTMAMVKGETKEYMGYYVEHDPGTVVLESWVFWNCPWPEYLGGLDIARTNSNYIYVGLKDCIRVSMIGGTEWEDLGGAAGALDICVDPQIAGAIYFWDYEGSLRLNVAGVNIDILDTEWPPFKGWNRICRSLNSGGIWNLRSGNTLRKRLYGVVWEDQLTGLYKARGMHCYWGDKLIFVSAGHIYVSDDGGETVEDKTGDWSGCDRGLQAHRFIDLE